MMSTTETIYSPAGLSDAYKGSWYTIAGAGGAIETWTEGYTAELQQAGIGEPEKFYVTTGRVVNLYALTHHASIAPKNQFPDDLVVILFPLTGLDPTRLPIFKVQWQDRWFDDVIDNMGRL
jgi:hypothetical protein